MSWKLSVYRKGSSFLVHQEKGLALKQVDRRVTAATRGNIPCQELPRETRIELEFEPDAKPAPDTFNSGPHRKESK